MLVTPEQAYRAVTSRDTRFDGYFITAVRTTGIYCRPSCPARTPRRDNVEFFATAGAAQTGGYRACKRCLPDAVPGSPEWDLRADLAGRAMRLIDDGAVERCGVAGLAAHLGYSPRHLTRVLTEELGAGPLALARAHRAHAARILIETSGLALTDVAFAAGFASLRQFNDTIREVFATNPSTLRTRVGNPAGPAVRSAGTIRLRLPFRPPYDAAGILRFLADRTVVGAEQTGTDFYSRTLRLPHGTAVATLRPAEGHLRAALRLTDVRDLGSAVARLRRLFDLDCDPVGVDGALARVPELAGSVAARPGVRVPGSVDGTETLVRTILGQQVSVAAARTGAARLTAELGEPVTGADTGGPDRLFPGPEALAEGITDVLGGPRRRLDTIRAVCEAMAAGELHVDPGRDGTELRRELRAFSGVGAWTADYVSMRVLGEPDVLLSGDLALRRGAAAVGMACGSEELRRRSRQWSPWRSYAGMHLWRAAGTTKHGTTRQREEAEPR